MVLGGLSCCCALFGIAGLRRWAETRMLDVPNSRSSHVQPRPRGGGLAMAGLTCAGAWSAHLWGGTGAAEPMLVGYSLGMLAMVPVSCLDDVRGMPQWLRFMTHVAAAGFVLWLVGYWEDVALPFVSSVHMGWLGALVAFLWMVGLTNAYNFMDGIDGLAGGQAVVAGVAWMGLGVLIQEPLVSVLGVLVAGSSLGFLWHNWPPARIFMGDVGSAFLGYTVAALTVMAGVTNPRMPLAGLLVVWPFVFDTAFTLMRRLRRGENIFMAHRAHLYQRLVIAGYGHGLVTGLYLVLSGIGVLLAFAWVQGVPGSDGLVLVVPPVLALGLWRWAVGKEKQCGVQSAKCGKAR